MRRQLIAGVALVAAVALATWASRQQGVDLDPEALRARIEALGWLAPVGFIAIASLRTFLLLPSWVVMTAGGLLFGVVGGVVCGTIGFTAGAVLAFGIARGLGRDAVESRIRGRLAVVDAHLRRRGALWIAGLTALPVAPLTPVHATAGLSGMRALAFAAGVLVGLVPRTALYSFFGDSFAQGDASRIVVASLVLGLAVILGIVVMRSAIRRAPGDATR